MKNSRKNKKGNVDFSKSVPKVTNLDKEKLYEDKLHLKKRINELNHKMSNLVSANIKLNEENKHFQDMFAQVNSFTETGRNSKTAKMSEFYLVNKLRMDLTRC